MVTRATSGSECRLKKLGLPGLCAHGGKRGPTTATESGASAAAATAPVTSNAPQADVAALAVALHSLIVKPDGSCYSRRAAPPLLDSAASHHMPPNQEPFLSYTPSKIPVTLANGKTTTTQGIGVAKMSKTHPSSPSIPLQDASHVPPLTVPLSRLFATLCPTSLSSFRVEFSTSPPNQYHLLPA